VGHAENIIYKNMKLIEHVVNGIKHTFSFNGKYKTERIKKWNCHEDGDDDFYSLNEFKNFYINCPICKEKIILKGEFIKNIYNDLDYIEANKKGCDLY
jgi:hypothetical protein